MGIGAYPKIVEEVVHEVVAIRLTSFTHGACDVADQANSHGAEARLFLVCKGIEQEGREGLHILGKVLLYRVRQAANRGKHGFGDT